MVTKKPLWIHLPDDNGIMPVDPVPNPDLTAAEFDSGLAELVEANIETLWQAAHAYEFAQISGSAIGLLVIGVGQGKPKAIAVQAWIGSIWTLYYSRKAVMGSALDPVLLDFSPCGPIPHTVPELRAEIGL